MKRSMKLLATASVTGVIIAGSLSGTALAWHSKGVIKKYVQNQTAGGQMADADTAATAVNTKPGDTLKYTIVIENQGAADSRGYNDMYYTKMTDTLPAGVELVSTPTQRTISEDIGVVKAGQKVTKEYLVKVTSAKDGDVIENKACFTGDSQVKDNKQGDCNTAVVKVSVPKQDTPPTTTTTTTTTPTPSQPQILAAATELPNTGAGSIAIPAGLAVGLGYAGNLLRLKRHANKSNR